MQHHSVFGSPGCGHMHSKKDLAFGFPEGLNPETSINDKHRRNNVYGFVEYSELLQEAYCTLQFDHYNSVIDNDHVLRAARNLFLYHIISDIKKRFNYDDMK